jgi:hypothetical protein
MEEIPQRRRKRTLMSYLLSRVNVFFRDMIRQKCTQDNSEPPLSHKYPNNLPHPVPVSFNQLILTHGLLINLKSFFDEKPSHWSLWHLYCRNVRFLFTYVQLYYITISSINFFHIYRRKHVDNFIASLPLLSAVKKQTLFMFGSDLNSHSKNVVCKPNKI